MRLYYEIALRSFRRATSYRSAYVAGIITNAFFGALLSFVYIGVYGAGGSVGGFTLQDAVSYVWVAQAMITAGGGWLTFELADNVYSGQVANDIARPWSFYGYWLSRTLGERLFNLLMRGAITYLIGFLYFGARVPSPAELAFFLLSLLLGNLVSFGLSFALNLSAFWLVESAGIFTIATIVTLFFSGFLLPISFMPEPLATLARALPFQTMTGLPAQVFLGQISGGAIAETLLLQLGWAVVLTGIGLAVERAAFRKLVIQGG
jgi:ABC-2 type transport system permease protein